MRFLERITPLYLCISQTFRPPVGTYFQALAVASYIDDVQALAQFERCVAGLALIQGLRASSTTGASSMLVYTSLQEDGRGSLSVLKTQG
jgi:hypothetical protein